MKSRVKRGKGRETRNTAGGRARRNSLLPMAETLDTKDNNLNI